MGFSNIPIPNSETARVSLKDFNMVLHQLTTGEVPTYDDALDIVRLLQEGNCSANLVSGFRAIADSMNATGRFNMSTQAGQNYDSTWITKTITELESGDWDPNQNETLQQFEM